jgi:diadenylate cyclase
MTSHEKVILNASGLSIENDAILSISIIVIVILIGLLILLTCFIIYGEKVRVFFAKIKLPKFKKKQETRAMIDFVTSLTGALLRLSKDKIGALIVIENHDNLGPYINIGNRIDSYFNLELVVSVFYNKLSPLHDGAMIIRN